jgi:triphosphatase
MTERLDDRRAGIPSSIRASETDAARKEQEIEIKFSADAQGFEAAFQSEIFSSAPAFQTRRLRSVYFDTAAGDLRKRGITLRIRKTGRAANVLNVKVADAAAGGPFLRKEIEVKSPDFSPNFSLFGKDTANALARLVADQPLEAQFETLVKRSAAIVDFGESRIEVAFDDGSVIFGGQRVPLLEVELELKSGAEADLYGLAVRLAEEFPLRLDFVSKAEKGFRAVRKENATHVNAQPIPFSADATLDRAVTAVILNTLLHFVSNWAALRDSGRPESIHQMRVALRRMRSGLAMFKRALPCPEFEELRADAKRIASALGPVREWDALRQTAEQGAFKDPNRPDGNVVLISALEKRRFGALAGARAVVEARDTTLFVLKAQSLLARRAWRNGLSDEEQGRLAKPVSEFAANALARLNARALKRGAALPDVSDTARHELRIALKNLRYAAEFFGSLFGQRRKREMFLNCVSQLQDLLGAHNDAVMTKILLRELCEGNDAGLETASGFILGWHARGVSIADEKLQKSWKAFKRAKAFWK